MIGPLSPTTPPRKNLGHRMAEHWVPKLIGTLGVLVGIVGAVFGISHGFGPTSSSATTATLFSSSNHTAPLTTASVSTNVGSTWPSTQPRITPALTSVKSRRPSKSSAPPVGPHQRSALVSTTQVKPCLAQKTTPAKLSLRHSLVTPKHSRRMSAEIPMSM